MSFRDAFQVAIEALISNKLRACLTMLGIVIGVGAVIALMSVGQGSQQAVKDQIQGLGANLLFVTPGSSTSGGINAGPGSSQTLTSQDADAIESEVGDLYAVAPQVTRNAQIISNGQNSFASILGVTPEYVDAMNLTITDGAFFTQDDIDRNARVAVLGSALALQLYPDGSSPVGAQLNLNAGGKTITLQIVGVLQAQGGNASSSYDNQAILPLTTVQKQISMVRSAQNATVVSQITLQVATEDGVDQAKQEVTDLLLSRHKSATADFTVKSQDDIAAASSGVAKTLTMLLGAVASISLVVGGIGIMNIMLVSVTERTREIGIRKAIGARPSDIMMQFLTEAVSLTVTGGLLGVIAGVGASYLLNGQDVPGLGDNVRTMISWPSVFMAFGFASCIGIFFGLYPAHRAAKLRPIDALHHE
jgi:putative ABC transport system permease protein